MNFKKLLKILVGLAVVFILFFAILFIKIYSYSFFDNAQKADAIVALGASQWNGEPSPVLKARLDHALSLYENNLADKFILTGGIGRGEKISESQAGKDYLIQKGVDGQNIFIEENGRTTLQSLKEVKNILSKQNFNSAVLVSDGFHSFRLEKMAVDLGIKVFISPAKESPVEKNRMAKFKYIARECVVFVLYRLFKI